MCDTIHFWLAFLMQIRQIFLYLRNIIDKTLVLFGLLPTLRRKKKWLNWWSNFNVAVCKNKNPEKKNLMQFILFYFQMLKLKLQFANTALFEFVGSHRMFLHGFNFLSRGIGITRWFVYRSIYKDLWHTHFDLCTASFVLSYTLLAPMTSALYDFQLRYSIHVQLSSTRTFSTMITEVSFQSILLSYGFY